MTPEARKKMILGALVGTLASGAVWFYLGNRRVELEELKTSNEKLVSEVEEGIQLKAGYEKLKQEVGERENRIAELVKSLPLESERARVGQMIQRLANTAGLGQLQSQTNVGNPVKHEYHLEYSSVYKYLGGFHEFGNFLSLISGYNKIINISDIVMARETARNRSLNPASIEFRLSVYVYDTKPIERQADKPVATAKPARNQE